MFSSISFTPSLTGQKTVGPQRPWMDTSLSPETRASLVEQQMTLDEKIRLVHGVQGPKEGTVIPSEAGDKITSGAVGFVPESNGLGSLLCKLQMLPLE